MTQWFCMDCRQPCEIKPLDNSFSFAGTHCTGGRPGVEKPAGYGEPVSDCCEAEAASESGYPATREDLVEDDFI